MADMPAIEDVEFDEKRTQQMVALYKALANPVRIGILLLLLERGPMAVNDIVDALGNSQSGVSHQLEPLRDRGLIDFTRDGNRVIYRIASEHVHTLLQGAVALLRDRA